MSNKEFTTAEEFYKWATDQMASPYSATATYTFERKGWDREDRSYRLIKTGGSSSHRDAINLPADIGAALAQAWKRGEGGEWARYRGNRTAKGIVALLDQDKAGELAKAGQAIIARIDAERARTQRNNARQGAAKAAGEFQAYIARQAHELGLLPGEGESAIAYFARLARLPDQMEQ